MLSPIPYLGFAGYQARSKVAPDDVALVAQLYPGYIERKIARGSSWTNARLAKRYIVPLGQQAPQLIAVGTAPPSVALSGRPVRGDLEMALEVLVPGALGAALFQWSEDGGDTWTFSPTLLATGTTPPAVTVEGAAALATPELLGLEVTTGGALGAALFQWSADGGVTWNIGASMAATGTTPPAAFLSGVSSLASPSDVQVQITTGGPLGTAVFQWSEDGGVTWTTGLTTAFQAQVLGATGLSIAFAAGTYATNNAYVGQGIATAASYALGDTGLTATFPAAPYTAGDAYTGQGIATAATVVLGGTGLTATMAAGTYSADNVYSASTPIDEVVLGWVVALVDVDVWERRGGNPQDPTIATGITERDAALAEIKEAADSKDGLFNLPTLDTLGASAIARGGPLMYTEASPYVAADRQEREGRVEDGYGGGTYGGDPWPSRR